MSIRLWAAYDKMLQDDGKLDCEGSILSAIGVGLWCTQHRTYFKISRESLSKISGISVSTITTLEQGRLKTNARVVSNLEEYRHRLKYAFSSLLKWT